MSGICGWIDSGTAAVQDGSVLTDMLTGLNGDDLAPAEPILINAGAIAARSGIVPVFLQRAGTLVVAVQGRVDWHLPDLSMLAAERGCAAGRLREDPMSYTRSAAMAKADPAGIASRRNARKRRWSDQRMGLCQRNPLNRAKSLSQETSSAP